MNLIEALTNPPLKRRVSVAPTATEPTDTAATVGTWNGLIVGDGNTKHRGMHVALLCDDGRLLCVCGPAEDPKSVADARMLAHLWNAARKANVSIASLN